MPIERIASKIHLLCGEKVMLDSDHAKMYGAETSQLNRAVKRDMKKFPVNFMFKLIKEN